MNKRYNINRKLLAAKVSREFYDFETELLGMPAEKILNYAPRYVFYKEILSYFTETASAHISEDQAEVLARTDNILDCMYETWKNNMEFKMAEKCLEYICNPSDENPAYEMEIRISRVYKEEVDPAFEVRTLYADSVQTLKDILMPYIQIACKEYQAFGEIFIEYTISENGEYFDHEEDSIFVERESKALSCTMFDTDFTSIRQVDFSVDKLWLQGLLEVDENTLEKIICEKDFEPAQVYIAAELDESSGLVVVKETNIA